MHAIIFALGEFFTTGGHCLHGSFNLQYFTFICQSRMRLAQVVFHVMCKKISVKHARLLLCHSLKIDLIAGHARGRPSRAGCKVRATYLEEAGKHAWRPVN